MLENLIRNNRSYRRFYQEFTIKPETLRRLINLASLSASAKNLQPLRYMLFCEPTLNTRIFPNLSWAGYLKDWPGPEEGERPSAYIVMLADTTIKSSWLLYDAGIAAQSILLGAVEKELGGCIIASVKKNKLRKVLQIPERYEILVVIALGKPRERVVIDPVDSAGNTMYWREVNGTHHVPKRSLDEIIISSDIANP